MNEKTATRVPKRMKGYQIVRLLGRGGMGEVFLATHHTLDRPVAIKRYAPGPGVKASDGNEERFLREGKALARLRHHGIIAVHDMFENRGEYYLVLEYVDGCSVADLVASGPLPVDIACIIGLKLAEALEHAHFHRIVHRDLKGGNVMISRHGDVKLMDFGIARGELLAKITQTGILVGTPIYLPPEVVSGEPGDARVDIYGLGAVIYQCLSGRRLFYNATDENLFNLILAGQYVPLRKAVRGVPRALRAIVHRCLARKPADRFQTASEVRQSLDLFMAREGIWSNHAERLVGFLVASNQATREQTMAEVKLSDSTILPTMPRRRNRRLLRWAIVGAGAAVLVSAGIWVSQQFGWWDALLASF